MNTVGIIPARFASTRFPGKPLVEIGGKSMIRRVYEQACRAASLQQVVVATDDARIHQHVLDFGGQVVYTRADHPSGTDRCAEVAATLGPEVDVVVNIQGDEPFIDPAQIDALVDCFRQPHTAIATLARALTTEEAIFTPHVVKVVFTPSGQALYFSRHPIPYLRSLEPAHWAGAGLHYQHVGLYAYRREVLLDLAGLPPGTYEQAESLEQLRWLEAGYTIQVALTALPTIGIDTPDDLAAAQAWWATQSQSSQLY